jgi:hypothetical protein
LDFHQHSGDFFARMFFLKPIFVLGEPLADKYNSFNLSLGRKMTMPHWDNDPPQCVVIIGN